MSIYRKSKNSMKQADKDAVTQEQINKNIIENKILCYITNGNIKFCIHGPCKFDSTPCAKMEEIMRGN